VDYSQAVCILILARSIPTLFGASYFTIKDDKTIFDVGLKTS